MNNKSIIYVWKPQGWTPLKAVGEFMKKNPEYKDKKVSYAGRLDPMAEGVLLLLIGDENKKRKDYEGLPKVYTSEIVLGISTDSFDGLGIIYSIKLGNFPSKEEINKCLKKFLGKQDQIYPPYSSKNVNGKSLIWWAKEDRLSEIEIPKKEIEIYSLSLEEMSTIEVSDLCKQVKQKILEVEGNFRQEEILDVWNEFEKKYQKEKLLGIKIKISCSSGTYIRRLTSDMGEDLGCGAFALSITRISVGNYSQKDAIVI